MERDATGPALSGLELATLGGNPGYVHVVPSAQTLYYAPSAGGSLQVSITAADTQSGLNSLTFPDVFTPGDGDVRSLAGRRGPETFQHQYPLLESQEVSATFQVSADDKVGVSAWSPAFRVMRDAISPTVAVTRLSVASLSFQVAWGGQDDRSGLRGYYVQYKVGITGTWTSWLTNTSQTRTPFVGEAGESYFF